MAREAHKKRRFDTYKMAAYEKADLTEDDDILKTPQEEKNPEPSDLRVEDYDETPSRQSLSEKFKDSKIEKEKSGDTREIEEDLENLQKELQREKASPHKEES